MDESVQGRTFANYHLVLWLRSRTTRCLLQSWWILDTRCSWRQLNIYWEVFIMCKREFSCWHKGFPVDTVPNLKLCIYKRSDLSNYQTLCVWSSLIILWIKNVVNYFLGDDAITKPNVVGTYFQLTELMVAILNLVITQNVIWPL